MKLRPLRKLRELKGVSPKRGCGMTKSLGVLAVCVIISLFIAYQYLPSRRLMLANRSDFEKLRTQNDLTNLPTKQNETIRPAVNFKQTLLPSKFLLEESDFCIRNPDLDIIAYVHTTINQTEKRKVTRETWVMPGHFDSKVKMGVVFMVGQSKTDKEKKIVSEESKVHHDIVQGDYVDSYHMLSYKALASLQWVFNHCSHVPWTLHVDDDVLLDPFLLTKLLKTVVGEENNFMCYSWKGAPVKRTGRWLVQPYEFPEAKYPTYCSGAVWVLATRLIHRLLSAATKVPFLWVDDVYLTGVLAKEAGIGHFKHLRDYIKTGSIKSDEFTKKMAWVHISNRSQWWQKLLKHYGYA